MRLSFSARTYRVLDVALVVWLVFCLGLAVLIAIDIRDVDKLATTVVTTTTALTQTSDALRIVGNIPLVGAGLGAVVDNIHAQAAAAQSGAEATRASIRRVSVYAGIAIGVIPSVLMLALYLPLRLSWRATVRGVRRSLADDPDDAALDAYLARRAIETIPFDRLRAISADPWQDVLAGRLRPLADAELARLGLRRPGAVQG